MTIYLKFSNDYLDTGGTEPTIFSMISWQLSSKLLQLFLHGLDIKLDGGCRF
jgi:hypothetical protein